MSSQPQHPKTALVAPLGWGLGHASRDIPIIAELQRQGCRVVVAGDSSSIHLIQSTFTNIEAVLFPSYRVRYRKGTSQLLPMLWVAIRLPFFNVSEHIKLRRLVGELGVDIVISDNRYGLWSKRCKSVIITHQLRVIVPYPFRWAVGIGEAIIRCWLRRFNEVWIPDVEHNPVAGKLSLPNGLNSLKYVGIISRLAAPNLGGQFASFQMVVVASGPEPHRQIFISRAAELVRKHHLNGLIIEGNPSVGIVPRNVNGVWHVGHLPDSMFALAVVNSRYIIFRGGYSTVMDMLTLGVSGLMVPTPGQTEQEYLAKHLGGLGLFRVSSQHSMLDVELESMRTRQLAGFANNQLQQVIASAIG